MTKTAPISYAGLKLIKAFEGFRAEATLLPNGIWVIGHGHTISARKGGVVGADDAENLLIWDMTKLEPKVKDCLFAPVSQAQIDGLLSLAFNIGIENFADSDVVRFINQGKILSAAAAFDIWRKASFNGNEMIVDALVRRRTAEKARFLDVEQGVVLAPSARLHPQDDLELAKKITEDADALPEEPRSVEVSIDLSNSAALGSLMSSELLSEDGLEFSFDPSNDLQPNFTYSDDDFIETDDVANGNMPEGDLPVEQAINDPVTSNDALVPISDVFVEESTTESVREVAEKIAGRLSEIASEELPDDLIVEDELPHDAELPPMADQPFEETYPNASFEEEVLDLEPADQIAEDMPPLQDEEYLSPQSLSSEVLSATEQPFEVLEKRNTGMFVLMGITGLILAAGGIFETSKSGFVVTLGDMIKGPGLAGFGILLVLVAVYFLLAKPKK